MARPGKKTQPSPAARLHLFLDRAERIAAHPLGIHDPRVGVNFSLHFDENGMPRRIDVNPADPAGWKELGNLIRPIIYLEDEPVSINGILNLVSQLDETQRPRVDALRKVLRSWRTTMYWGTQTVPGPEGIKLDLVPEEPTIIAMHLLEVGDDRIQELLDEHPEPMVPDYSLAETYFYGELWHANADQALELAAASPFRLADYIKAAEVRTTHSVPYILAAADIVKRGLDSGALPRYEL